MLNGDETVRAAPDPSGSELDQLRTTTTGLPFRVDDAERANWVVRRVLQARAYSERVRAWADREVHLAEREEDRLVCRFGPQLQNWVRRKLAHPGLGPQRSVRLPAGTVGFRRAGPKVVVDDVAAVTAWARRHLPEAVVTREHLDKALVGRHVRATGELPDEGLHVEPGQDGFYIR